MYCDQSLVKFALTSKNLCGRLGRWGITLQEYDIVLNHRPGKQNANADALSRAYEQPSTQKSQVTSVQTQEQEPDSNDENEPLAITTSQQMSTLHRQDPQFVPLILYLEEEILPTEDPYLADTILAHSSRSCLKEGVLFCTLNYAQKLLKHRLPGRHAPHLLVIPRSLQDEVLEANHSQLGVEHFGMDQTFDKISLRYYWPNL